MTVALILKAKGNAVFTIEPTRVLSEAVQILCERKIGAVIVTDAKGKPEGILSERDIVAALGNGGREALMRPVKDFMSSPVITCARGDSVEELMERMTDRRIRHLPVVEQGRLVGIVSIGDVVKRRIAETEFEANSMREYIAHA